MTLYNLYLRIYVSAIVLRGKAFALSSHISTFSTMKPVINIESGDRMSYDKGKDTAPTILYSKGIHGLGDIFLNQSIGCAYTCIIKDPARAFDDGYRYQLPFSVQNITPEKHVHEISTPSYPTFIKQNWNSQGCFMILFQNIDCGYSLEPPQRGGSNVYPQSMF